MTIGSVEPLKRLHERWRNHVHFVDVLIRQAHPGPGVRPYTTFDDKMQDAQRYKEDESVPWPVLVDSLEGAVHQVYGGLADPTYLIDADGRVAYYYMWTHAPNLNEAIAALRKQRDRGVVNGGIDHVVHMLPSITDGWRGIRRGFPRSYLDLELAVPGLGASLWLGHRFRPLLAPITLRANHFGPIGRGLVGLGAATIGVLTARAIRQRRR